MKKTILLLAVLCFASKGFCQIADWGADAKKEYFRFYYVVPGAIGNNVIAKANKGNLGLGVAVTVFAEDNYHAILGFEASHYDITDVSMAGNAESTYISNVYAQFLYKIQTGLERVTVNPKFAFGYVTIGQRAEHSSRGRQQGISFSPGFDVDFKIAGPLRIFAGIDYTLSFPETNTNAGYKSFYGTIQQLNVTLGIKL